VEVESKNRNGVNQALILFFGLIIVVGAVIIYLYILRGVFGRFDSADLLPDPAGFKSVIAGEDAKVGILYSRYTENMLPDGDSWLNDNINSWKRFLGNTNLKFEIIADDDIELGRHYKFDLLILPGSKSLSDAEIVQLKRYADNGGSIFATTGTASYSHDGKWRGWEFLSEVFGIKFSGEMNPDQNSKVHTMRGGLPLTANVPTGYPLKIATWDRPMAVEVLDPRTTQASFWYDYRMNGGLVREEIKKSAGIVYGAYGKGRFVWMGFELNSIHGGQEDYIYFERFFKNAVNWLTYTPIGFIREWPNGYDAAALIAPSLSNQIENIDNLLPILAAENVKATFFIDVNKADTHKKYISQLFRYGEVAAVVDIGYKPFADDTINNLFDLQKQKDLMRDAKNKLQNISNSHVCGVLPYYGLFDKNTIKAAAEEGFKFILTDSLTNRSVPQTVMSEKIPVVMMTRTARDDYEIIRDYNLNQPEFQLYTYQEDIDRILFEGGMFVFKFHTEYQCLPKNIGVVSSIIKELKEKKFWITTADEIAKWAANRNYVDVVVERRGDRRVAFTVSNSGNEKINHLVVEVDMNTEAENISMNSEIIGTKKADYEYNHNTKILKVSLDNLNAGESRTYYIDYDTLKAS
jgi:peptidoglycan/xylan/chitin deacetylase (PgdA/CDA1 family)